MRYRTLVAGLVALAVLVPAATAGAAAPAKYYVALGDSFAAGCVPDAASGKTACPKGGPDGYVADVFKSLKAKNAGLKLKSFACPGETTGSFLNGKGNVAGLKCNGGKGQIGPYEKFAKKNKGNVAFVSVAIGGNDIASCVKNGQPDLNCITAGFKTLDKNVPAIAKRVKKAAGKAKIAGTGYNDPFLAYYTKGDDASIGLAKLSLTLTKTLEDRLTAGYGKAKIKKADVRGAFQVEDQTPTDFNGVTYPLGVVQTCKLSGACDAKTFLNIHPNAAGYKVVADANLAILR